MRKLLIAYVASLLMALALDGIWLSLTGDALYRSVLGDMMAIRLDLASAAAFYLVFIGGVTVLATAPALKEGSLRRAALNGAVLGFVAYATYDLTNQATLARWSLRITLADMAWGTFLSLCAALAGYGAGRLVEGRKSRLHSDGT